MKHRNLITIIAITLVVIVVGLVFALLQNDNIYSLLPFASFPDKTGQKSEQVKEADELFQNAQPEQAYHLYTAAIDEGIDLANAYGGRGHVYMQWRRFIEASQDYTNSLERLRDPNILASRCNAYRLLAKFDLAKQDCQEAIELEPENIDAYLALTSLYLEQGDIENARSTLDKALEVDPASPNVFYVFGQVEMSVGNSSEAIVAFTEAIQLDPNVAQFYWDRGFAHYTLAELEKTKEDMRSVIEIGNPKVEGELIYKAGSLLNSIGGLP